MRPGSIPALLCALALLAGCAATAPIAVPTATPTPAPSPTPPPPAATPGLPAPTGTFAPQPLQVPEGLNGYAQAYAEVIVETETEAEGAEMKYDLVYLDNDGVPELVVGHPGYSVSVYQYDGGALYPVIDHWGYGAMGFTDMNISPKATSSATTTPTWPGPLCMSTTAVWATATR